MVGEDNEVAKTFSTFFHNAVKELNIEPWDPEFTFMEGDDPILSIVKKYENHPSILKIKENMPTKKIFSFHPVSIIDVVKEIENLDKSKASPIESIPAKIVKDNCNIFAPKITNDFNSSIETGMFPSCLKLADITPAFKKDDMHEKSNFRPVSILPAVSKVYERSMDKKIGDFLRRREGSLEP